MTSEKFVLRLLDASDQLLAWQEVWCEPRPEGQRASCPFWPIGGTRTTAIPIDTAGAAVKVSIHWCDLDIARMRDLLEPVDVVPGTTMQFHWMEPVWLTSGMSDVPLPAVTVRQSVVLGMAPATLGARS